MKSKEAIEARLEEFLNDLGDINVKEDPECWPESMLILNCWILAFRWVLKDESRD